MVVVNIGAGSGGGGSVAAGTYSIKNRTSGMVIDNYGSTANGATVYQYTDGTGSNNQKYTLSYDSNGYARLMCVTGSEYLDSLGNSGNGSVCGQWPAAPATTRNGRWCRRDRDITTSSTGPTACAWTITVPPPMEPP